MYEINNYTYALIGEADGSTKILESNKEIVVDKSVNKIINNSCKYFGSSYEGRVKGSKNMINADYKVPIIIEETKEIIFFPTESTRNVSCSWISLNAVDKYSRLDDQTLVTFKNGNIVILPISYESFDNQILRATRLLLTLKQRKQVIETNF